MSERSLFFFFHKKQLSLFARRLDNMGMVAALFLEYGKSYSFSYRLDSNRELYAHHLKLRQSDLMQKDKCTAYATSFSIALMSSCYHHLHRAASLRISTRLLL